MKISEKTSKYKPRKERSITDKVDDYILHPKIGYLFLGLFFGVYFLTIFLVGDLISGLMEYPLTALQNLYTPLKDYNIFLWRTVDGTYQGVAGGLGIVMPYFLPLVFLTSIFEDSGYLARVAFLVDGIMHKIGLHGKSVAAFILGFGCTVPAIYATRILENKRDRIITGILIPFIPCSARISVIFALAAAFTGPFWAIVIFFFVMLVIAINGKVLSKFIDKPLGMIMEIPSLKAPNLKIAFSKTSFKIKEFVKHAFVFLIVGSILLSWIEQFNVAHYVNYLFAPILKYALGLPTELGSTLVFGFFRKELIIVMANQAFGVSTLSQLPLTIHQTVVFLVFVTLYFPCFTTIVVIYKEFGAKVALFSGTLSVIIATISAFMFKTFFDFFS
jgi:ferrous iron transport protein B